MIARGWDQNFDRFLGTKPKRHARFAALDARGISAPTVTVSWKGVHNGIGYDDGIRDLACFASASVAHVSAHADHNGLSISVTSGQSATGCENLLRDIVRRLGGTGEERVWTLHTLPEAIRS